MTQFGALFLGVYALLAHRKEGGMALQPPFKYAPLQRLILWFGRIYDYGKYFMAG